MKSALKTAFPLSLCLMLSGCAFNSQKANIAPVISIPRSSEGAGVTVAVRVMDERPAKALGRRGAGMGPAAEITAAEDLGVVVQREVVAGLRARGFETTEFSNAASPRLSIEIRLLEYSTSTGFWTGGVQIQAALKASAVSGSAGTFDKMYRSDKEERVLVVPTAQTNEKWINERLSDVLTQLLSDPDLLAFLIKRG